MTRPLEPCRSFAFWLRDKHGRECLAALTGQDRHAIQTFVHGLEFYAVADGEGQRAAEEILRNCVRAMQQKVRRLAKACIPMVLDWGDEERLWGKIWPTNGHVDHELQARHGERGGPERANERKVATR